MRIKRRHYKMDNKELEKIYEESYRAVYWTAMSLLKDEDEAQDIVQETYVSLISSYSSIRDKDKVYGWLKKTAANKSLNRLTRTKTVNTGDEFLETVEALPEDFLPESIVESDEKRKIIMDIIDNSLSEDIRTTLVLYYFDEMSTKEIASALGIPQGTVLWRLSFAKKKIKQEVETYEKDNNDKLYAMAIPFLTKLFTAEADSVPMSPMPASLIPASASDEIPGGAASKEVSGASRTAAKKVSTASKAVAKKGMSALTKKVLIGVVSSVLAVAVIVAIVEHIDIEDTEAVTHTTWQDDDQLSDDQIASNEISSDIEPDDTASGSDVDATDEDENPYRVALMRVMNDQILPDGTPFELEDGETISDCRFGIEDYDVDGVKEILLSVADDQYLYYEYNEDSDSWNLEFESHSPLWGSSTGWVVDFYYEGSVQVQNIYRFDSSTCTFECVGNVRHLSYYSYEGDFPAEYIDDGEVYIIDYPGYEYGYYSRMEYDEFTGNFEGYGIKWAAGQWSLTEEDIDEEIARAEET
jgi:RNA polymerase sigma factor (sigma-70 family)